MSVDHSVLLYGAGGAGKTHALATLARYVNTTTGKRMRVISADGGGVSPLRGLIKEGLVDVWYIDQWEKPFQHLEQAVRGSWPVAPTPNSPLVVGIREWKPCPSCKGDTGGGAFGATAKCNACGKTFAAGTVLPVQRDAINGLEGVGAYAFEGLTALGDLLMRKMKTLDAQGAYSVMDDGYKLVGAGRQHYGLVQEYLAQYVAQARALPVPIVVWTALEVRADDDGKPVYGPDLPGKKLTTRCIPWFTDVIHLDVLPKRNAQGAIVKDAEGLEELQRKMFLQTHYPPDNPTVPFRAKSSVPGMPATLEPDFKLFLERAGRA